MPQGKKDQKMGSVMNHIVSRKTGRTRDHYVSGVSHTQKSKYNVLYVMQNLDRIVLLKDMKVEEELFGYGKESRER